MKEHIHEMMVNKSALPSASLKWRIEAIKIIKEHRGWTLDSEIECLLNICVDMYSMGLEDARDYVKHIIATDNVDAKVEAVRIRDETFSIEAGGEADALD
jgi:hypothetical protein